jgi:hypothetical protein
MSSIVNSPDILAALRERKHTVKRRMEFSRTQMQETANNLTGKSMSKTTSRALTISRLVINGIAIYKGFRFCTNVATSVRSLFALFKRR